MKLYQQKHYRVKQKQCSKFSFSMFIISISNIFMSIEYLWNNSVVEYVIITLCLYKLSVIATRNGNKNNTYNLINKIVYR